MPIAPLTASSSISAGNIIKRTGRHWRLQTATAFVGLTGCNTMLLMGSVSCEEVGLANDMIYLFQTLGQVIGVGTSGATMQIVLL
ncbi:hypothetical protein K437DRAFT_274282 [Tilletiaria anomala UBC 951]|uniref:Major facilitator superfamily (MFS) profile domain-containing protein n=1 Tax=Tilletiaria anomala (strain ATCC 24038 / CBS 436.72 / UBC 951) TaxID=1037660 RepID=A0A066VUB0_TILAU|nr:uncharacterized protein K437DRAFT_274282 [Tilletiaria anomala UBC 951]KDN45312.1 hypothetical protein K437DRAFT_274282 [Tilletiaria anomala UBC 951]